MEQQKNTATGPEPEFAVFIGIDWADKKHYWSLSIGNGRIERGTLDNTPEAVEVWMMEIRRRFEARPVAVALEQRKGALVTMLGKYEHAHLYPVHPRTVAKLRQAWYPSGSKDDVKDADLLLEILTKNRDRLRRLDPDTKQMRLLQFQVENRRKLVDERTALANKLKGQAENLLSADSALVRRRLDRTGLRSSVKVADPGAAAQGKAGHAGKVFFVSIAAGTKRRSGSGSKPSEAPWRLPATKL